jgi:hypothetical protein
MLDGALVKPAAADIISIVADVVRDSGAAAATEWTTEKYPMQRNRVVMDKELSDRVASFHQRLVQLRDSL